jgi:D-alanyl-D-alanine carboxypeptidase (penicillin-binding protein 5/6)
MNARARELGLNETHFNDPCGHDKPRHYTSAHDLAILVEFALRNQTFRDLVSRREMLIRTVDGRRHFLLRNKNHLLGRYPGAIGVKTGYTGAAGRCLVALAERDGTRVLLVMLHARNRWHNAAAMLDRAFLQAGKQAFANRSSSRTE